MSANAAGVVVGKGSGRIVSVGELGCSLGDAGGNDVSEIIVVSCNWDVVVADGGEEG